MCAWQYFDPSNSRLYTSQTGETFGEKYFTIAAAAADTANVTYYADGNGISDGPVLDVNCSKYICNYYGRVNMEKPVLHFSCMAYIPAGTETTTRRLYLSLSKNTSDTYNNNTYGTVYYTLGGSTGTAYGGASANADNVFRKSQNIVTDAWNQISIRVFTNVSGKITYAMYLNENLFIVCESTAADISFDDLGISQIYFETPATTYVKDIRLDLEDYDPLFDPAATSSAPAETYFSNVTFNTLAVTDANALNARDSGIANVMLQTSSQTTAPYKSGSVYENVTYTLEDHALKVELAPSASSSGTHALIQNFRKDITSYFPSGTNYMQLSCDVQIPAGTEAATREQYWRIGNNTASSSTNLSCYEIYSKIANGQLTFENRSAYPGDVLTKKTASFAVQNDKWYRILALLKIENNSDSAYTVHTEGYVLDLEADATYKIYEVDGTIPKLTPGTDGLVLTQQRTDVTTPQASEEGTTVSTYYDNMFVRFWNDEFSAYYRNLDDRLPADADYQFAIDLTQADGVAAARGRDADGSGTQKVLIAGYDSAGKLVACAVSQAANDANTAIDPQKGIVTLNWDFSPYTDIKTLKAFMFSDLPSIRPLAGASTLELS